MAFAAAVTDLEHVRHPDPSGCSVNSTTTYRHPAPTNPVLCSTIARELFPQPCLIAHYMSSPSGIPKCCRNPSAATSGARPRASTINV